MAESPASYYYPKGLDPNKLPDAPEDVAKGNDGKPYSTTTYTGSLQAKPRPSGFTPKINFHDPAVNVNNDSSPTLSGYAHLYDALQPEAPAIDPRYKATQDLQKESAKTFRDNIGQTESDLYAPMAGDTNRQLAATLHGVKAQSNQRGLLFGGSRMAGEGAARGAAASDLSSKRAGVNQSVENTADALDTGAIGTGFGMAGLDTGQYNYNLNQAALNQQTALGQMQAQQQGIANIGQGIGAGIGTYIGYKKPSQTPSAGEDF